MRLAKIDRGQSLLIALAGGRPRHELEFLPAALEVIDTPASPAARMVSLTICAFCATAITWSIVGRIDIVANAPGTILPSGKVKVVQPSATSVVEQVLVADGDHVQAGQIVVRLDAVEAISTRDRLGADLAEGRLEVAGLRALDTQMLRPDQPLRFAAPEGATPSEVAREHATVIARAAEQQSKLGDLTQQIAEKTVEAAENRSAVTKLRADLPMLAGVRDMYHRLEAEQLASKVDILSSEEKYSDTAYDLASQIEHGGEAETSRAALQRQYQAQEADYARGVLQDLGQAEQKLAETDAQYRAAAHDAAATVLRAPATGVVQQLAVHSIRGVVTPAETLMVVVPDSRRLAVEAMIANRDIGFVHVGQAVKVKVAAFSFTRYGLVPGRVVSISRDSVDDTPVDPQDVEPGSKTRDAVPQEAPDLDGGEGRGYVAAIALDRDTVATPNGTAQLRTGMSVTAEIRTGRRRVISYLLSPVIRYTGDAGHER